MRSGRGSATGRAVGLWLVAALAAAGHDPLDEHGKASLARHVLLRLGAGDRLRVGGAASEHTPAAARPDGRGARDPG